MPLNAQQQAMLSSGLNQPVPPSGGEERVPNTNTFQNISGVGDGNYGMPFGTGSTIHDSGTIPVNTANPGEHRAQDFNEVGGNVAGLYGRDYSLEDSKTFIPEEKDNLEEQTNMFLEADEEGYTSTEDTRADTAADYAAKGAAMGSVVPVIGNVVGGTIGAGIGWLAGEEKGEQVGGGIKAARAAKRADRTADRKARKEKDLKGGKLFSAKNRRARRYARQERKESWKNYTDEMALRDVE